MRLLKRALALLKNALVEIAFDLVQLPLPPILLMDHFAFSDCRVGA